MSAEKELNNAFQKGVSDVKTGAGNHPPSKDGIKATIDTAFGSTTSDQRDQAYHDGRSHQGRQQK